MYFQQNQEGSILEYLALREDEPCGKKAWTFLAHLHPLCAALISLCVDSEWARMLEAALPRTVIALWSSRTILGRALRAGALALDFLTSASLKTLAIITTIYRW
jgi:hypothetical protein